MKIYFVRHGQSKANIGELEPGPEELLSDLGREQAAFVGKRFSDIPISRIITSPYARTRETADIISAAIGLPIEESPLFVERTPPSELIGKRGDCDEYMEIRRLWAEHRKTDENWRYSDEETYAEIRDRARDALAYLVKENADNALVVTHAGFLQVLVGYMVFGEGLSYPIHLSMHHAFRTKNTGVTIAEYTEDPTNAWRDGWKLHAWNDHAHL